MRAMPISPEASLGTRLSIGLAMVLLIGLIGGCGVKGPPVPPRQPPLPPVVDLVHQVAGQTVTLSWRLPGPLAGRQASQGTFTIYRSRSALAQPACESCPPVFEKVATVPYVDAKGNRFTIDVPLDPGYRYVFKVRLETDRSAGPDSNRVRFDYDTDAPSHPLEKP